MNKFKNDLVYGINNENKIKSIIEKNFNLSILKTDNLHPFDFQSDNIYFEVKSRRCIKNQYLDTMIGYNKIKWLKENNFIDAYFIFVFEDGNYYHKYINDDINCSIRIGGRWDRGKVEKKLYYYIPTKDLKILI